MNKKEYQITDKIYGTYNVDEVIIEIINTSIFQRLKGVSMSGAASLIKEEWNVSRYDHSIGVMILSKRLGATVSEQIKALIHDISHTAFSHVIDYVTNNREENYHDLIFEEAVINSEIKGICKNHELDIKEILNSEYLVLEADLPVLSLDRLDYSLRDLYTQDYLSKDEINDFINHLVTYEDTIYCGDQNNADFFDFYFTLINNEYYQNPLNVWANSLLAEIIKKAIDLEYLSYKSFIKLKDVEVLNIIESKKNKKLNKMLRTLYSATYESINYEGIQKIIIKERHVRTKVKGSWLK